MFGKPFRLDKGNNDTKLSFITRQYRLNDIDVLPESCICMALIDIESNMYTLHVLQVGLEIRGSEIIRD